MLDDDGVALSRPMTIEVTRVGSGMGRSIEAGRLCSRAPSIRWDWPVGVGHGGGAWVCERGKRERRGLMTCSTSTRAGRGLLASSLLAPCFVLACCLRSPAARRWRPCSVSNQGSLSSAPRPPRWRPIDPTPSKTCAPQKRKTRREPSAQVAFWSLLGHLGKPAWPACLRGGPPELGASPTRGSARCWDRQRMCLCVDCVCARNQPINQSIDQSTDLVNPPNPTGQTRREHPPQRCCRSSVGHQRCGPL